MCFEMGANAMTTCTVTGTHGTFTFDSRTGFPADDWDGFYDTILIQRFDRSTLAGGQGTYDILTLGYWWLDPVSGATGYEPPAGLDEAR